MKNIFVLFTSMFTIMLFSQEINTDINNYRNLDAKTTYFIKTGDDGFDNDLIAQLDKNWKFTKIEYITADELVQFEGKENKEKITQSYFLTFGTNAFDRPYKPVKKGHINDLRFLFYKNLKIKKKSFELETLLGEVKLEDIRPDQLIYSTQLLNSQLHFALEMDITNDIILKDLLDELSKENKYYLKDYTLFVDKDYMDSEINTEAEFKEVYPYPFQFSDKYEVRKIIEEQKENAAYIKIISYSGINFVTFISAKNATILFGFIMRGPNQTEIRKHFFKKAIR